MQFPLDFFSSHELLSLMTLTVSKSEQSVVIFFLYLFSPLYCLFMFTDHGVELKFI